MPLGKTQRSTVSRSNQRKVDAVCTRKKNGRSRCSIVTLRDPDMTVDALFGREGRASSFQSSSLEDMVGMGVYQPTLRN